MLGLAIAVSILLRGRPNRPRLFFAALAFDTGLWYLAQWLYHSGRSDLWARWTAVLAVFLPQFALHLFEAIVPEPNRRSMLLRVASILAVPMLVLVLTEHRHDQGAHGYISASSWVNLLAEPCCNMRCGVSEVSM